MAAEEYVVQSDGKVIPNQTPIAEQVSSSLPQGSTVTAPDGYIWFGTSGGKPGIKGVQETSAPRPRNTGFGGFVTYQNGQEVSKKVQPYFPTPAEQKLLKK